MSTHDDNDRTLVTKALDLNPTDQPKAPGKAYLIVVAGHGVGEMFPVLDKPLLIGRGNDCDIMLDHNSVSRHHAQLDPTADNQVQITDLGSTNGTYVDGQRVTSQTLKDGEKVQIADTMILKFSYQDLVDEQFQRKLFESAVRDPLTGAYNRRFFLERLSTDLAHALRHETPVSLAILDIDHFKTVNDRFGHDAGDAVLKALTKVIANSLRAEDVFARYGGEEFAVLLRDTDREQAMYLTQRIRKHIELAKFPYENHEIPITVSIGVATFKGDNTYDATQLLKTADTFLYAAKDRGRNRVESPMTCTPTVHSDRMPDAAISDT